MNQKGLHLEASATYEIRVQGHLDPNWSDRMQGLGISVEESPDKSPITTLYGPLKDQAALFGVLNALFALKLPLIFIWCLEFAGNLAVKTN
jgi:hypothetical protein